MNAIQYFNWGANNKKEQSDKIYKELLNNPIAGSFYYKKGEYWYKYTYPISYDRTVFSWRDIGTNDIEELVPYFMFVSILYLDNCSAKKIVLSYVLDKLVYGVSMQSTNDGIKRIIVPEKFINNITVLGEYILFNTKNDMGYKPYIQCDSDKAIILKNKIVTE
jgi:hypothetical protein